MAQHCQHCGSVLEEEYAERTFGDLSIVRGSRELWCNDRKISLTPTEEGILWDLLSGRPLSREAAAMRHGRTEETQNRTYDTWICRIRARLELLHSVCLIKTLQHLGWQMVAVEREYEQRAFGDVVIDLDRRLVLKGKEFAPVNPLTLETFKILFSGDLEPREKLQAIVGGKNDAQKKQNARQQIELARRALAAVGATVEIRNFEGRGYQMVAA